MHTHVTLLHVHHTGAQIDVDAFVNSIKLRYPDASSRPMRRERVVLLVVPHDEDEAQQHGERFFAGVRIVSQDGGWVLWEG